MTSLTAVNTVMFPVADQEAALAYYTDVLGFEQRVDIPFGNGDRWLEVGLPGQKTTVALVVPPPDRPIHPGVVGVGTDDVHAVHAELVGKGAEVGEIMEMGAPVPTMFRVEDPDANVLWIVANPSG